jgi:cell division protein FtsL
MKRLLIVGGLVVAVLAVAVYRAKLGAETTEAKIGELTTEARKVSEDIAVMKAEEAYLSRPERIGPIARQRLGLEPARPEQYTAAEALARRLGEERLMLPESEPVAPKPAKAAPKPAATRASAAPVAPPAEPPAEEAPTQ